MFTGFYLLERNQWKSGYGHQSKVSVRPELWYTGHILTVENFLFLFWGAEEIYLWIEIKRKSSNILSKIYGIILNHFRIHQNLRVKNFLADCNMDCNCPTKVWDPVCGNNGLSYTSACLAGCEISSGTGRKMVKYPIGLFFFFLNRTFVLCTALVHSSYELGPYLTKVKLKSFLKTKLETFAKKMLLSIVNLLHTNAFHSESMFVNPVCL